MLVGNEGDEVIVAGYFKGSDIQVMAWWNESRHAGGHQDASGLWPGVVVLVLIGILLGAFFSRHALGMNKPTVGADLLLLFGLVMMKSSLTTRRASRLVQRVRDESRER
jgi:undecaprenyl pyrophosphate phosphatase UppP